MVTAVLRARYFRAGPDAADLPSIQLHYCPILQPLAKTAIMIGMRSLSP
jgi:hypothetical protein